MTRVLFVCHGNICRSPMAEFVFRAMVQKAGRAQAYEAQSAALSSEELGNPVYPPARAMLARHGISCEGKYARQIEKADAQAFDLLIGMEQRHVDAMCRRFGADRRARCTACWIIPARPATLQTPGTPGILKQHMPR